jgi:CHASE2 domain-containing sensor protein
VNWRATIQKSWRNALSGSLLVATLGAVLLLFIHEFAYLSYDLLFLPGVRRQIAPDELVVVYLDDSSFEDLGQTSVPTWNRHWHANIVDRLTADEARLVVFDIVFIEPGEPSANTNFARAIRENGRVVLAASLDQQARPQIQAKNPVLPLLELRVAAAGWGITETASKGSIARQYFLGNETQPSMPWIAARVAKADIATNPDARQPDTWLNYYGPALSLHHVSYSQVTNQTAGYFRGKCVFIGARPKTLKALEEADVFPTPHWRWGEELFPGVEVGATAFLNLLRRDGLRQWGLAKQLLVIVITGMLLGAVLGLLRPRIASAAAALGIVICLLVAIEAAQRGVWFSWTIMAFAQIPAALAFSIRGHFVRLSRDKEKLEWTLAEATKREEASKLLPQAAPRSAGPMIPDHTLVRRVGKGAYGEVWLAKNAIGAYHAVKIMQRRLFPANEPYEREFRGIQKFMPISRSHPGLVHVLHVGRNDPEGFFFYIMEVGDDVTSGQRINPETYSPKTLGTEMEMRGMLPPKECLQLGLALTLALDYLHQQQLIHRDIKPANIIYVNGAPKFADIGLVTDIRGDGRDVSYLGTEGYIAPEGPGTASADVYALGKVLYEACMGRDRSLFPEVPTAILEQASDTLVRRLNQVIFRACETAVNERYQTAAEMHADLVKLEPLAQPRR